MMKQSTDEFNQARGRMADEIKSVTTHGEDLLNAAANVSRSGIAVAREKLDETLGGTKARLVDASRRAVDEARRTAAAANGYVHGNPWTVIGVAAAAGILIGLLASRR